MQGTTYGPTSVRSNGASYFNATIVTTSVDNRPRYRINLYFYLLSINSGPAFHASTYRDFTLDNNLSQEEVSSFTQVQYDLALDYFKFVLNDASNRGLFWESPSLIFPSKDLIEEKWKQMHQVLLVLESARKKSRRIGSLLDMEMDIEMNNLKELTQYIRNE